MPVIPLSLVLAAPKTALMVNDPDVPLMSEALPVFAASRAYQAQVGSESSYESIKKESDDLHRQRDVLASQNSLARVDVGRLSGKISKQYKSTFNSIGAFDWGGPAALGFLSGVFTVGGGYLGGIAGLVTGVFVDNFFQGDPYAIAASSFGMVAGAVAGFVTFAVGDPQAGTAAGIGSMLSLSFGLSAGSLPMAMAGVFASAVICAGGSVASYSLGQYKKQLEEESRIHSYNQKALSGLEEKIETVLDQLSLFKPEAVYQELKRSPALSLKFIDGHAMTLHAKNSAENEANFKIANEEKSELIKISEEILMSSELSVEDKNAALKKIKGSLRLKDQSIKKIKRFGDGLLKLKEEFSKLRERVEDVLEKQGRLRGGHGVLTDRAPEINSIKPIAEKEAFVTQRAPRVLMNRVLEIDKTSTMQIESTESMIEVMAVLLIGISYLVNEVQYLVGREEDMDSMLAIQDL